jgi:hypothetical protein
MFTELWNNKTNILKNYVGLVKTYLPDITIIIILFALIVIYAYIRYKGFNKLYALQALHELETRSTINTVEGFANNTTAPQTVPPLLFVTPETLKQILQTIHTTYLAHFNQPNIQARGFDTRDEMVRSYNKCLIPITDSEKMNTWRRICEFVDTISDTKQHESKQKEYIQAWLPKIQIAKGAPWLESGMPHTHANCIIMRPDWFGANFKSNTFIHELTHVIQRDDPTLWNKLYNQWGFIQARELSGLESYLNLNRANPDGMTTNWIWHEPNNNKYYWIAAVYKSVTPSSLTDINYLAIPVIKTSSETTFKYTGTTPRQISSLTEFHEHFGIDENHYHPNEIAAQYAEYYFSSDGTKSTNMIKYPGYVTFDKWFSSFF